MCIILKKNIFCRGLGEGKLRMSSENTSLVPREDFLFFAPSLRQALRIFAIFVLCICVVLPPESLANDVLTTPDDSTGSEDASGGLDPSRISSVLRKTFNCLKAKGKIIKEGAGRADASASAWSKAFEKTKRRPTINELHHLMAQTMWESGYLSLMTKEHSKNKKPPQFADRGFLQVSGKANYKMCAQYVKGHGEDTKGFENGGDAAENAIGDGAKDLTLTAMCSLGWWENARKSHKRFSFATNQDSPTSLDNLSRWVNKGPGAKSHVRANGLKGRRIAYRNVGQCMKSKGP
jgi:hypothetical protein